jgi:3-phosphoshikimate 1-carboxyvinyltransferase
MRVRPMGGLIDALEALGARFTFYENPGCFPFEVRTAGLKSGSWRVDATASSQMLSALMLVAPLAGGEVTIQASGVRPAFVEMTAGLMRQFGIAITGSPGEGYSIGEGQSYLVPDDGEFRVEPDATAASYFLTLPFVVGGSLKIPGMRQGMLQGDTAFAGVLESLGMRFTDEGDGWSVSFSGPGERSKLLENFQTFSDTFLTLAAVAPLLPFTVRIEGIGHTRFQETDRIDAVTTELKRIGAPVSSGKSFVEISPFPDGYKPPSPLVVETYRDHRIAMAFTVLGCSPRFVKDRSWLSIADPGCCGKTFPRFFDVLESLYRKSHDG